MKPRIKPSVAEWRRLPATAGQKTFLAKHGVDTSGMNRGQAADKISELIQSVIKKYPRPRLVEET